MSLLSDLTESVALPSEGDGARSHLVWLGCTVLVFSMLARVPSPAGQMKVHGLDYVVTTCMLYLGT